MLSMRISKNPRAFFTGTLAAVFPLAMDRFPSPDRFSEPPRQTRLGENTPFRTIPP